MLFIVMFATINLMASPVKSFNLQNFMPNDLTSYVLNESGDSISINNKYLPIHKYLKLEENQIEFFDYIHNDLKTSMEMFSLKGNDYSKLFAEHLYHDLSLSKSALREDQYHRYLTVINMTMHNKNIMNSFIDYQLSTKKDNDNVYEN